MVPLFAPSGRARRPAASGRPRCPAPARSARVGARLDVLEMLALRLEGNQDVAHAERVVPRRVHADDVVSEARQDGLAQLPRVEPPERREERGVEPALVSPDPSEVAPTGAARG